MFTFTLCSKLLKPNWKGSVCVCLAAATCVSQKTLLPKLLGSCSIPHLILFIQNILYWKCQSGKSVFHSHTFNVHTHTHNFTKCCLLFWPLLQKYETRPVLKSESGISQPGYSDPFSLPCCVSLLKQDGGGRVRNVNKAHTHTHTHRHTHTDTHTYKLSVLYKSTALKQAVRTSVTFRGQTTYRPTLINPIRFEQVKLSWCQWHSAGITISHYPPVSLNKWINDH